MINSIKEESPGRCCPNLYQSRVASQRRQDFSQEFRNEWRSAVCKERRGLLAEGAVCKIYDCFSQLLLLL